MLRQIFYFIFTISLRNLDRIYLQCWEQVALPLYHYVVKERGRRSAESPVSLVFKGWVSLLTAVGHLLSHVVGTSGQLHDVGLEVVT